MNWRVAQGLMVIAVVSAAAVAAKAQTAPRPAGQRIAVCGLLPKAEVRKHLPWSDVLDRMGPPEEEAIGAAGSSCNYPSVLVQVFPAARLVKGVPSTQPGWQQVAGIGEEAWFRANGTEYAELYVKTAMHTLTLQADAKGNVEAVKPGTLSLARALLAALR